MIMFLCIALPIVIFALAALANYHYWDMTRLFMVMAGIFAVIVLWVVLPIGWYGAEQSVKLINAKFGTSYTTEQYFWSGETIKTVIEGQKLRVKVEQ